MYYVNFRLHPHALPSILKSENAVKRGGLSLINASTQEETLRNLRSRSLSAWDEAPLLFEYIRFCGITQSECAARLGRSQSSVANRLRLLRLTPEERSAMQAAGLSERHARALLRLPPERRRPALQTVAARGLSVSETEAFVEALLRPPARDELRGLDAEIRRLVDLGICTAAERREEPNGLTLTLFFPGTGDFS